MKNFSVTGSSPVDRRQFLKLAAVPVLSGGLAGGPLSALAMSAQTGVFAFDVRLPGPVPGGAQVIALGADVSTAWFARLAPALRGMPAGSVVTGLTYGDALFCLRQLAADMGWILAEVRLRAASTDQRLPVTDLHPTGVYTWAMRRAAEQTA